MSKRYVFWRKPDGGLDCDQNGKYAPKMIFAEYGKEASINANGGIKHSGFLILKLEAALKLSVVILTPEDDELNETDAWNILRSSLVASVKKCGGGQPLEEKEVITTADKLAAEFFRKELVLYTAVSSLSLKSFPAQSVQIGGCRISLLSSLKRYPPPNCLQSYRPLATYRESSKYKFVKISTSGRSVYEAMDHGLRSLHLLRGLWSLFATYRSWSMSSGGSRKKLIGVIHSGPVHTLHNQDGKPAVDMFWGESGWTEDRDLFDPEKDKWEIVDKNRRYAMRQLRKSKSVFQREMERLIVRYAIALDQTDHDVTFLQMWSVLEKITDTIGRYDETVKRAVWPFTKGRQLEKEILNCMRSRRNLYVHAAEGKGEPDQAAYLIKEFVDIHLVRLIQNSFDAASIQEYARHLMLSSDLKILKRERKLLGQAIRALTPSPNGATT